jgi:glycosyltransferase involved in cell wall biosynthesis
MCSLLHSKKKISILHVTPWFPTSNAPANGIWIKRQISLLEEKFENYVIHISVNTGKLARTIIRTQHKSQISYSIPSEIWRIKEFIFYRLLKSELNYLKKKQKFDVVNFHIAYPALIYIDKLKKYLPAKQLITEHWSAYHYNFHSHANLDRIKRIFQKGIPIICVSNTLKQDIIKFSGVQQQAFIVPNHIDHKTFNHLKIKRDNFIFMAALWAFPKKPFELLEEWRDYKHKEALPNLHIAGEGPLWNKMVRFVEENQLEGKIKLLGNLDPTQMALEMNHATALLLPSEYETFSVITIEALYCGLPVVTNNLDALRDILTPKNSVIRKSDESWISGIRRLPELTPDEREIIAKEAHELFNTRNTTYLYESAIDFICSKY